MSNQNRQPRQPRQVKIFSIEALSAARMDVIAEHRRVQSPLTCVHEDTHMTHYTTVISAFAVQAGDVLHHPRGEERVLATEGVGDEVEIVTPHRRYLVPADEPVEVSVPTCGCRRLKGAPRTVAKRREVAPLTVAALAPPGWVALANAQAADDRTNVRASSKRRPLDAREGAVQWWREHAGEAAVANVFGEGWK